MKKAIFSIKSGKNLARFCSLFMFYGSVLCAGIIFFPSVSDAGDEATLKSVRQDIASKQRIVTQQQRERGILLEQLKTQEGEIASASRLLHDTQKKMTESGRQITALNVAVSKLERQQMKEKQELAVQLDAAFRMGRQGEIQSLLEGEDRQRDHRLQIYYGYLNQARQKTLTRLQQTQQQLTVRKQDLQTRLASQHKLLEQQKSQRAKLERARDARKKTLVQLESSIQQGQQQLAGLRQNEVRLRDSIARARAADREKAEREAREAQRLRLRQQESDRTGSRYKPTENERSLMARTGGLGRPQKQYSWPVQGSLLHQYAEIIQGELRWKGIVIKTAAGTEIKAIADGRVILVDWLQGYGLVMVIEHGKGDMSLYGYNESALVNVGDLVHAGQPVVLAGDSGGQGQSALYFEIRRQGQAVNPLSWLKK